MKKNQLSKLAILGIATGVAITSTIALSANPITETKGTYLAGGCGGGGKCGGSNRPNPTKNYTADTFTPASNTPVNPNMAPKPEAMQNGTINTQDQVRQGSCSSNSRPANGQSSVRQGGSCSGNNSANGQRGGSCNGSNTANGQRGGSCNGSNTANGQRGGSCSGHRGYNN